MDNETLIHVVADCVRRQSEGTGTTTPAWSTTMLEQAVLVLAGDYLQAATALQATVSAPTLSVPVAAPLSTVTTDPTPVAATPAATSTDTAAS